MRRLASTASPSLRTVGTPTATVEYILSVERPITGYHQDEVGDWVVHDGRLRFAATTPAMEMELGTGAIQAIPPGVEHRVVPVGVVHFIVEFFAVDRGGPLRGRLERPRGESPAPAEEAGDPACWAGLVCQECGAITDGGPHRAGCPAARATE